MNRLLVALAVTVLGAACVPVEPIPHSERQTTPPAKPRPALTAPRAEAPALARPNPPRPYVVKPRDAYARSLDDCPVPGTRQYDAIYARNAKVWPVPEIEGIDIACWEKGRAQAESSQLVRAASGAGAKCLMQLLPSTAADLGVTDIWDPEQCINAGMRYSAWCYSQWRAYGRTPAERKPLADVCYEWGLGNQLADQERNGWRYWTEPGGNGLDRHAPKSSRTYVGNIRRYSGADPT